MKNFFKINGKYINIFRSNVYSRFVSSDKKTDTSFLKSLFDEIYSLFLKIGGRVSNKNNIQKDGDYPDSNKYNRLITDISIDMDKLYTSHKIIEDDINNLIKFNSYQREQIENKILNIQQSLFDLQIINKISSSLNEYTDTFEHGSLIGSDSKNVFVDESRKILTLDSSTTADHSIDIDNVEIFFIDKPLNNNIYPDNIALSVGSFWKKESNDPHFVDNRNLNVIKSYKSMLIDDPNNSNGIGICEFEAVDTYDSTGGFSMYESIKTYIRKNYNKPKIYIDMLNSLHSKYIRKVYDPYFDNEQKFKVVIPFNSQLKTNEVVIEFTNTYDGYAPPIIIWDESKLYSGNTSHNLIPCKSSSNGKYSCMINTFVIPDRLELVIKYKSSNIMWNTFDYYMSQYTYKSSYLYSSIELNGIRLIINDECNIFVDSEYDEIKEKTRAVNILKGISR